MEDRALQDRVITDALLASAVGLPLLLRALGALASLGRTLLEDGVIDVAFACSSVRGERNAATVRLALTTHGLLAVVAAALVQVRLELANVTLAGLSVVRHRGTRGTSDTLVLRSVHAFATRALAGSLIGLNRREVGTLNVALTRVRLLGLVQA